MLKHTAEKQPSLGAVKAYLYETLGADVHILPWGGEQKLPYFLHEKFHVYRIVLEGREFLLASAREETPLSLSGLKTQLSKLADIAGQQVVFSATSLASYERKRLVQQKLPFIVPGNQLYLPDLGIDFREYFRQPKSLVTSFSPATQAMFISALLKKEWRDDWRPSEVVSDLGYTPMTLSRAVRELEGADLLSVRSAGKTRSLHPNQPAPEAWAHAKPFLRTPVRRTVWVSHLVHSKPIDTPLAGLSALAFYTMLSEPPRLIVAVGSAQWKAIQQKTIHASSESDSNAMQCQIWSYTPRLLKDGQAVDPLSLTLSLSSEQDERIQQSLDALREQFPW